MRLLADESCDFSVVYILRDEGHDVIAVLELCPGAEDQYVIELAARDKRVLLTEDKDFGRLVYAKGSSSRGVLLLRFPATARSELCHAVVRLIEQEGNKLQGAYTVLQPGYVRIGRLPP